MLSGNDAGGGKRVRDEQPGDNGRPVKKREKKKKKKKKKKVESPTPLRDDRGGERDYEESDLVVEGIVYNETIYLLDRRKNVVYSGQRSEEGDLVRVGVWNEKQRKVVVDSTEAGTAPLIYPFSVDPNDHCETPFEAYEDIAPLIEIFASMDGVKRSNPRGIQIYDPYYCAGSVKQHFSKLGFPSVYNECENFYEAIKESKVPVFDALVTNPPYSQSNVEKLVEFCTSEKQRHKPFFLLMPNYFVKKPYYVEKVDRDKELRPFYVAPRKRYRYRTPKGGRDQGSMRKDRKTAPFVTFWYCSLGSSVSKVQRQKIMDLYEKNVVFKREREQRKKKIGAQKKHALMLIRSTSRLPNNLLDNRHQNKRSSKR